MEYRISILLSDTPTYTKDVYENISDAEKALNRIDEDERMNYGIAQILSEDEIIAQANRIQLEENERKERMRSEAEKEEMLQNEIVTAEVKGLNSDGSIEINGKIYYPEN